MPEDYTPSHYTEFCPACSGLGKIHYHNQPGDDNEKDTGRALALILIPLITILAAALIYGLAFR